MIDKSTKIFLTYNIGGEYLVQAGSYSDAKLSKEPNELYTKTDGTTMLIKSIEVPSRCIEVPIYSTSVMRLSLGFTFIKQALERPEKPHQRATIQEWNIYHNWNKMGLMMKLQHAIEKYVSDMHGYNGIWSLI